MSTKKLLTFFPEHYKRIYDAAIADGMHICSCATVSKARKLRQNLYSYRASAKNLAEVGKLSVEYCQQLHTVTFQLQHHRLILKVPHEARVPKGR